MYRSHTALPRSPFISLPHCCLSRLAGVSQKAREIPSYNHRSVKPHKEPSLRTAQKSQRALPVKPAPSSLPALCLSLLLLFHVCVVSAVVFSRARDDFHRHRSLSGPQQAEAITIAYTQLDNLTAQVAHMRHMLATDMLVHRGGMVEWKRDEEAQRRQAERDRKEQEERKRRVQEIRRQQRQQAAQQQTAGRQQDESQKPQQHEPSST